MIHSIQRTVSSPYTEPLAPFPRLCQASELLGKTFAHHGATWPPENNRFDEASQLYEKGTSLSQILQEEATASNDYISLSSAIAVAYSALCALCNPYSCPRGSITQPTEEEGQAQIRAIDGLKSVSQLAVEFAERLNNSMPLPQDVDRTSPFIMDALYCAASNHAWWVRENGDEASQLALDGLRNCLRRLGTRWRNAAEYLRILEAQEFTYAIGGAGT